MKWSAAFALLGVLAGCPVREQPDGRGRAPTPVAMDPARALGAWTSGHGDVAIGVGERGDTLVGTWRYQREGFHEGRFQGYLNGNVLTFAWVEGEASGEGWIAFAPDGSRFDGEWWGEALRRSQWVHTPVGSSWNQRGSRPGARFTGWR